MFLGKNALVFETHGNRRINKAIMFGNLNLNELGIGLKIPPENRPRG
jgi:hypothetical protein